MSAKHRTPILIDSQTLAAIIDETLDVAGADRALKLTALNNAAARLCGKKFNWGRITGSAGPIIAQGLPHDVRKTMQGALDTLEKGDADTTPGLAMPVIIQGMKPGQRPLIEEDLASEMGFDELAEGPDFDLDAPLIASEPEEVIRVGDPVRGSEPWHISRFFKSEKSVCLLLTDRGQDLLRTLEALGSKTGCDQITVHAVTDIEAAVEDGYGGMRFKPRFNPSKSPDAVTVYEGVDKLKDEELYLLMHAALTAEMNGIQGKIFLVGDSASPNVKTFQWSISRVAHLIEQIVITKGQMFEGLGNVFAHEARLKSFLRYFPS